MPHSLENLAKVHFGATGALETPFLRGRDLAKTSKLPNGKPIVEQGHCSVSHGGGWVIAAHIPCSHWHRCRGGHCQRFKTAAPCLSGLRTSLFLTLFGDNLDTLCRLWTAKEAAFKVFGRGLDFSDGT